MNSPSNVQTLSHASSAPAVRWDGHMSDGVGTTYGPTPLAFLSATSDEILLCGNRGNFRLPRTAIRRISRSGLYPWFFTAVQIRHGVAGYPAQLEFKALGTHCREILDELKTRGFPVG